MSTDNDKGTLESTWPIKILCSSEEKLLLLKNHFGNQGACFNSPALMLSWTQCFG